LLTHWELHSLQIKTDGKLMIYPACRVVAKEKTREEQYQHINQ